MELLCFLKVLMLDKACTGSFAYDDLHSVLIKNKIKPTRMMDVLFYLFFCQLYGREDTLLERSTVAYLQE